MRLYVGLVALALATSAAAVSGNWWAAAYAVLAAGFLCTGEYATRRWKQAEAELADMRQVLHAALRHDPPTDEMSK